MYELLCRAKDNHVRLTEMQKVVKEKYIVNDSLVEVSGLWTVDVVPPVTVEGLLVEDGTVGTEELRTLRAVTVVVAYVVQLK